jgi:hypothetical protein
MDAANATGTWLLGCYGNWINGIKHRCVYLQWIYLDWRIQRKYMDVDAADGGGRQTLGILWIRFKWIEHLCGF